MNTLMDFLAEARSAHQRNDWRASYEAFVRADGLGAMPTGDLEAYSAAAWRLGYANEAVRLAERVYDRLVRADPAAAAMKAAELALEWHARGHRVVSQLWADRARGLLAGVPAAGTLGYLAYLDAVAALAAGDDVAAVQAATALRDTAVNAGDATLAVLARVVDGVTALLESRIGDGYRLIDDALLPVLDERVALEWAGDVYRLVLRTSGEVDAQHRHAWTQSMQSWCSITRVVIDIDSVGGRV
jgi:hypothetical protein